MKKLTVEEMEDGRLYLTYAGLSIIEVMGIAEYVRVYAVNTQLESVRSERKKTLKGKKLLSKKK